MENYYDNKSIVVNNSVTQNTDNYAWRDLNCIYRPLATIFKSFNENYFNYLLLWAGLSHIYCLDEKFKDFNWDESFPFFDYFNN